MPYKVVPYKNGFKVRKTDRNGNIIGSALSTRALTREAAMSQMRALYAAENKKGIMDETPTQGEVVVEAEPIEASDTEKNGDGYDMEEEGPMMGTPGPTSFEELMRAEMVMESAEQAQELTDKFQMLARNIFSRDDITDKGAALEALAKEYGDLVQGAMALAKEQNGLWGKIKASLGLQPGGAEEKSEPESLYVWKEGDTYKWLAAYSNNRRDNDDPPEIISSESHKEFDLALEVGDYPMPELELWHVPYPVGITRWHAYDEANGFPVAAGEFYKGMEWAAKGVIDSGWSGVSHGMPKETIARDKADPTIIVRHRTKEISILPVWAAANKFSFNIISKEQTMSDEKGLPAHKREEFEEAFGPERVEQMEAALADKAKEADDAGIEKKDNGEAQPETVKDAPVETEAPAVDDQEKEQLYAVLAGLVETVNEMKDAVKAQAVKLDRLESDKEQAEKEAEADEPGFSRLLKMLETGSVIGKPEAQIDERSSLAKDAPAEADSDGGFFWKDIQKHNANYGRH